VHGTRIAVVEPDDRGRGHDGLAGAFAETDALITGEADLPIAILTADCYAIALLGERSLALLHAGWRGTLYDLAGICVRAMRENFAESPDALMAWMSPGIRSCCYRVDEGRAALFVERFGEFEGVCVDRPDGCSLDLEKANLLNLVRAGLRKERIRSQGDCTSSDAGYFSYRRDDGTTGRQATIAWMT
jgi:YfiH family protein